jgi:putative ABC transport system permease protein
MDLLWRTPLATLQLRHHLVSTVGALMGVSVAVLLMFMEEGFQKALYRSAVRMHRILAGDLIIAERSFASITIASGLPRRFAYRAASVPGVAAITLLYSDTPLLRNPQTGSARPIMLYGIDPLKPAINPRGAASNSTLLALPGRALFDRLSRASFGPVVERVKSGEAEVQLSPDGNPDAPVIRVIGLFDLGPTITFDGTVLVSDLTFHTLIGRPLDRPTFGVLTLAPGAELRKVKTAVQGRLGGGAKVMTKAELINLEIRFWDRETPIGYILKLGLFIGFSVGLVFVYQVLQSIISNNLPEYAVLKTVGYPDYFFVVVLFQMATVIGTIAFIPGLVTAQLLYAMAERTTGLDMSLRFVDAALIFAIVLAMCTVSAMLAARRLRGADPISLFS